MKEEWFPLVNEKGETIGKATRKECHNGSKMLHPVVHLHIFNTKYAVIIHFPSGSETKKKGNKPM